MNDSNGLGQAILKGLADAHRDRVAACIDHDLAGPRVHNRIFATCNKCRGRFKVQIEGGRATVCQFWLCRIIGHKMFQQRDWKIVCARTGREIS